MDKGKALQTSFQKLNLNPNSNKSTSAHTIQSPILTVEKRKPVPTLVTLCIQVIGSHLEDIIDDLPQIAFKLPSHVKITIAAIARRRRLLDDNVMMALAESSWDILDVSDSDVSDYGISVVAKRFKCLRAADISRCSKISSIGVSQILQHCDSLQILRWGGCLRSELTARCCLGILKPTLDNVEGESWEELVTAEIGQGAYSLRWLVWPKIDKDSLDTLSSECPRIIVNPKSSPFGYRGVYVPCEALMGTVLDDFILKDIDAGTWSVKIATSSSVVNSNALPIAERFRLAFAERDARLAPKRAKNARQHKRRAERDWVAVSTDAKAIALASKTQQTWN
ncbi:hypothetical protein DCAR_0418411 [Daucus carota subsp. sativus]|uniref:RNI-like superfamily protein n=1 Tax=Daucus carota subsp. sativus TaxID=79200 RepID=A0A165ZDY8_DAUCS|nr:PREDICTED: uncharacterized protein LOC108219061 isoform X1 [Daucus carota subsp. sativus]WOG99064.1 hypothetical protein DCAR_0418411 [Daucus carota subsp. sativus]